MHATYVMIIAYGDRNADSAYLKDVSISGIVVTIYFVDTLQNGDIAYGPIRILTNHLSVH